MKHREWSFFKRFIVQINLAGFEAVLLTPLPSIVLVSRGMCKSYLIQKKSDFARSEYSIHDIKSGKLSLDDSRVLYGNTFNKTEELISNLNVDSFWLWNGISSTGQALTDCAKKHDVKILYFEIANLPGKIYVDPFGVNTKSSILINSKVLDNVVDVDVFIEWKKQYLLSKMDSHVVPQAKVKKTIYWIQIIDLIFYLFGIIQLPEKVSLFRALGLSKFKMNTIKSLIASKTPSEIIKDGYIFLPFQLSSDTQLTLFSKMDNEDALDWALNEAIACQKKLVVKFHPSERDINFVRRILDRSTKEGFSVLDFNTFKLIERSSSVVTINSTVGLEAQLLGKPVIYLGESIFKTLNSETRLANYITNVLIDINYFDDEAINNLMFEKVLKKLEI